MEFVYPSFLYTLFLLGIPVGIHYLNLRRYKKLYFSNVPLLQQIQTESRSRDKLQQFALLASRLLAFILIILAFAQPYIPAKEGAKLKLSDRIVSVYVDNSYSMTLPGSEGNLLELARRKAAEIAGAFDLNTRFQLLTNDFEGRHQRLVYREEFLDLLTQVKLSPLSRTIPAILSRQHALLDAVSAANRQLYLVSDFQKNMLAAPVNLAADKFPIHLVRLNSVNRRNLYIDSVYNLNKIQRINEKEKLVIRIKESAFDGGHEPLTVVLQVMLNNQLKAVSTVRMTENSTVTDTVNYLIQAPGEQKLVINLNDQPITFDDHFFCAWAVDASAGIMVIHGGAENQFIKAVYQADSYFNVLSTDEGHINYGAIAGQKLIILDQLRNVPSALNLELSKYLAAGGNILFLPALDQPLGAMRQFLSSFNLDIPDTLVHQKLNVTGLNRKSDIFEGVFDKFPSNPNLPLVKSYIRYSQRSRMIRENIIRLGSNIPLLTSYSLGKGHWYQSATPFTDSAGTIQRHAIFVPLMYKLALTSTGHQPLYYEIGKDLAIPVSDFKGRPGLRLQTKTAELIPEIRQHGGQTSLFIGNQLHSDGIYALRNSEKTIENFAFNYNRDESIMSFYSLPDLQHLTDLKPTSIIDSGRENLSDQIKQTSLGTQIWKVCLILALVFLAIEEVIIRLGARKKAKA